MQVSTTELPADGRARVVIGGVTPDVDGGRTPVKRVVGDEVVVVAELVCDGHDRVAGVLHVEPPGGPAREVALVPLGQDRFEARFVVDRLGMWRFGLEAWVDSFATWRHDLTRRLEGGQNVDVDLRVGALIVGAAALRARGDDAAALQQAAERLAQVGAPVELRARVALAPELAACMARWPDRAHVSRATRTSPVAVDPPDARFAAWYELFPRSAGAPGVHGTLKDAAERLTYIADLGFDVVYLPPIHPIGRVHRKGKENRTTAEPGDPGSPWAVGADEGGHDALHPELGTMDDFVDFVARARALGLEVALDVALQASPDHPWLKEHPTWFRRRPDGSIQHAENPPKLYQDIVPFDFTTEDWPDLWHALRDVFRAWIARGVRVFRVDNPHTKPLPFWSWCLRSLKAERPDLVFLAEAFTRPSLKLALAKAGFTQGYTYFTWRHTPAEMRAYLEELTSGTWAEVFRPSFWPVTPDILPEELQVGGRPAFVSRLVLAATLSGTYGIYGPPFELMEAEARPGSGEYARSEKYELRSWDLADPNSLAPLVRRLNRARRACPALQQTLDVRFHDTTNPSILAYSKRCGDDVVLCVVSFDPHHRQVGEVDLSPLGLEGPVQAHDVLGDGRWLWSPPRAYVELDPAGLPAQVFRLRRKLRTEHDFDYYG